MTKCDLPTVARRGQATLTCPKYFARSKLIVGFTRYSRDRSFADLGQTRSLVLVMAVGSIAGTFIGARLLGIIPSAILLSLLAGILIISAVKVWRHE